MRIVCCQSCNRELKNGEKVVRVQIGVLGYSGHISLYRKATDDDYFCEECANKGNVAIRSL